MLNENLRLATITELFERLFFTGFNTLLLGGAEEPVYIPAGLKGGQPDSAGAEKFHRLYFRHDYLSSALHESAHWCIAGAQRREQLDFGYWYSPDGRSAGQQQLFEEAEVKPQALEWMFSVACGQRFLVSADNLVSDQGASAEFTQAVIKQAQSWCGGSQLPPRGRILIQALADQFDCAEPLSQDHYHPGALG
ncbi:MAG: elongation factor P hydroxylase [Porticoccaceae bacterium]|nr:elongation factor P hydroxylase [Porticoccaceae bacterium]